jgi:Na+/H+-dicarboxylate symporter
LPFGLYYGHLVYFVAFWHILWLFVIFSPLLVCCTKKNLATLQWRRQKNGLEKKTFAFYILIVSLQNVPLKACVRNFCTPKEKSAGKRKRSMLD